MSIGKRRLGDLHPRYCLLIERITLKTEVIGRNFSLWRIEVEPGEVYREHLNIKDTEYLGRGRYDGTYACQNMEGIGLGCGWERKAKQGVFKRETERQGVEGMMEAESLSGLLQFCCCWGMFTHLFPGGAWWNIFLQAPLHLTLSKRFPFVLEGFTEEPLQEKWTKSLSKAWAIAFTSKQDRQSGFI